MGLQAVLAPNAVDGGVPEPLGLRHRPHAPVRGTGRDGVERRLDHRLDLLRPDHGLAARPRLLEGESRHTPAREALAPEQNGWATHPDLTGDGSIRPAGGGKQDDPGPLHEFLRRTARADEEFEALALGGIEGEDSCGLEHGS